MSEPGSILRHGRVYALASVVNRGAGLALIPLFAHVLSPPEFGVYAIVQSVVDVLSVLVGFGFSGAMNRFYLEYPSDEAMRRRVVSTALICVGAVGLAVAVLAWPLAWLIARLMFGNDEQAGLFFIAIIGLLFTVLFEIESGYLVTRTRSLAYLGLSAAKAVVLIVANLVLVLEMRLGVGGILLATALSMGLLSLGFAAVLLARVGFGFSLSLAGRMAAFALPLVPAALANAALGVVERYALNAFVGGAAVAFYSLAQRLASLPQMFVAAPFSQSFAVRRVQTLVQHEDQSVYNRVLLMFVLLMSFCGLGLSAFAADLVALIAPAEYAPAAQLVPLLALAVTLSALNFNFELGLHYSKQTAALPLISVASLALCVLANVALVALFGLAGSVLAALVVNLGRLALTVALNARRGSALIRLDWPRAGAAMLIATALGMAWVIAPLPALVPGWMLAKLASLVLLLAATLYSPLLDATSRGELRAALSAARRARAVR